MKMIVAEAQTRLDAAKAYLTSREATLKRKASEDNAREVQQEKKRARKQKAQPADRLAKANAIAQRAALQAQMDALGDIIGNDSE